MLRKLSIVVVLVAVVLSLTAFANPVAAQTQDNAIPWWAWLLIILALVIFAAVLIMWWLGGKPAEEGAPATTRGEVLEDVEEPAEAEPAIAEQADDLKIIEGIGPKISQVLADAGIVSFADLAATSPDRIEEILSAESTRLASLADPTTWPEQAQLAADGKWDELKALQESLVGGRVSGPTPT